MLPVNTVFPEFVPDQLLTSSDLNELFGYLDEQGRMTRTNLIGIGIVCGLEVKLNPAKTELTITKGCGVTSEGYLISVPLTIYSEFNTFDAEKEKYYGRFVDMTTKEQKFPIWELKQAAVDPDATNITESFLQNKVVVLFVELLGEKNKNCDPNSCDDKGVHVNVTIRPLLVNKADAGTLIGAIPSSKIDTFTGLPDIRMRRFDVPNTSPVTSQHIFDAYKNILDSTFLSATENALTQAYIRFGTFVLDEFPSNPFAGLAADYAFLHNGTITTNQLQHIQYHYDLFSDFLLAYDEFRKTGNQILSTCCPDSTLFPRHLLLGEAIPLAAGALSGYRHYFIYSPLFEQKNLLNELKSLFRKLVLLMEKFTIPLISSGGASSTIDPYIRITPSTLGNVGLSQKAIPYYYQVATGPAPLYRQWNYQKTLQGIPQRNLSYHASLYNGTDDFVRNPLRYDLEPYNFLRIEGIIGKPYARVLRNIKTQITQNRLPVDVIALNTDNSNLLQGIITKNATSFDLTGTIANMDLLGMLCHFQDLEALYDVKKNEVLCTLCKELKYYYELPLNLGIKPTGAVAANSPSKVALFSQCSPGYLVKQGSFGFYIEKVYEIVGDDGVVTIQIISEVLNLDQFLGSDANGDGNPDSMSAATAAFMGFFVALFEVPVYIIRLANIFTDDLSDFDVVEYCRIHKVLTDRANMVKIASNIFNASQQTTTNSTTGVVTTNNFNTASLILFQASSAGNILVQLFLLEDFLDHLDVLIYNCQCSAFKAIREEYLKRVVHLTLLRQFGYFTKEHPGIQHKAGVPMGGTFIIVYHSVPSRITSGTVKGRFTLAGQVLDETGSPLPGALVLVKNTSRRATTNASGTFSLLLTELPVMLIVRFPGFDDKEVEITSENPVRIVLGERGSEGDGSAIDDITAGTVIADFYLPYRCCSDCPPIQYIVPELNEPPAPGEGPRADAGADQVITLPTSTVTLNGGASTDPDGTIIQYQWARLSGPGTPQIVIPNSAQTAVNGLAEGAYEFELTVTDNNNNTNRDTMKVTVNPAPPPPNEPPVANAGEDQTVLLSQTAPVILDGRASADPDGTIEIYEWIAISGPNAPNIITPGQAQTQVTGLIAGDYEFQLTVTDNRGATDRDTVVLVVEAPKNEPPVANAGLDQVITLPTNTVTLDASASTDPDGVITSWSWSMVNGPGAVTIGASDKKSTSVAGLVAGTYEFELKATDNRGDSSTDTVTVIVNPSAEKSCSPLRDIIAEFERFPNVDPEKFPAFRQIFSLYEQVQNYFKQLAGDKVADMPVDEQIDWFATPLGGQTINELLQEWLTQLHDIIQSNKNFRLLALNMYRILMLLAMYIMCIRKADFDKGKIPMAELFNMIRKHIADWSGQIREFAGEEVELVKKMGDDLRAEDLRINANGEASIKPKYLAMIRAILRIIDSI
jgi:hypothetical protein